MPQDETITLPFTLCTFPSVSAEDMSRRWSCYWGRGASATAQRVYNFTVLMRYSQCAGFSGADN